MGEFVGGFSAFFGIQSSLVVEFMMGVIFALEEAQKASYSFLWLECDCSLVYSTFYARTQVPWIIRNRWNKYLAYCTGIAFKVSHIFREGNHCADKLVNLCFLHRQNFVWYRSLLPSILLDFFHNTYKLLMFRLA